MTTQNTPSPAAAQPLTAQEAVKAALITEMFQNGLHFGHKKSRWNPKMAPYVYGVRNNIHIIDLNKTYDLLDKALKYIEELVARGGTILFIGTRTHASALTKETAERCNMPYVNQRWVGGTFTNFEVIQRRLESFRQLEKDLKSGAFADKYTKREQLMFQRQYDGLEKKWGGLKHLTKLPDAIFVLDMSQDDLAVKEANEKGVTVVALTDTNTDPTLVTYPIPANDDSLSSLTFIYKQVAKAIEAGKPAELAKAALPMKAEPALIVPVQA